MTVEKSLVFTIMASSGEITTVVCIAQPERIGYNWRQPRLISGHRSIE
jgi:hypothetical protein